MVWSWPKYFNSLKALSYVSLRLDANVDLTALDLTAFSVKGLNVVSGVIYIGDRYAGKTHLALELTNPNTKYVAVTNQNYTTLKSILVSEEERVEKTRPTDANVALIERYLDINVQLPSGEKRLSVDWIDTPGEIWRQTWQADNPEEWQQFLDGARTSEGILLVLAPYREALDPRAVEACLDSPENYVTQKQWMVRFKRWVDFFNRECANAKHLVICLNKVDLLRGFNLGKESEKLSFDPYFSRLNWHQRHAHVCREYLGCIQKDLIEINRHRSGVSIHCAVTTIKDRGLLEIPWIYLATFLTV
jgi:hypothetical protein